MTSIMQVWPLLMLLLAAVVMAYQPGELHSSPVELNKLYNFDMIVADVLRDSTSDDPNIKKYMESHNWLIVDKNGVPEDDFEDHIRGNPLHVYALIKRLVLYWPESRKLIDDQLNKTKDMECVDKLKQCQSWKYRGVCIMGVEFLFHNCPLSCGYCNTIEHLKRLHQAETSVMLPSDDDLQGAAEALARLHQVYDLSIKLMVVGHIYNYVVSVRLSMWDLVRVARACVESSMWYSAITFYQYIIATKPDLEMMMFIQSILLQIKRIHDAAWEPKENFFKRRLNESQEQIPVLSAYFNLCQGKKFDLKLLRMTSPSLVSEATLCWAHHIPVTVQGVEIHQPESPFHCYISARGAPYRILQPFRYEVVHEDPDIIIFSDVISDDEIAVVTETSKLQLERDLARRRDSNHAFISSMKDPVYDRLALRVKDLSGLMIQEGEPGHIAADKWKVRSYGSGGHISVHTDLYFKHVLKREQPHPQEIHGDGDRLATIMFYMNDVVAGGLTAFHQLGVAVKPQKGSAIYWHNVKRNGDPDSRVDHGGCPVLIGQKILALKWVREAANFLRRPCTLDPYE